MFRNIRGKKYELIEIFEYNNKDIGYRLKEENSSSERIVTSKEIISDDLQVTGLKFKNNSFEKTFASKIDLSSITKTKLEALENFKNTVELKDDLSPEKIETSLSIAKIMNKQSNLYDILNRFNEVTNENINDTESSIKFELGITYSLIYNAQAKLGEAKVELSLQVSQEEIMFNSRCIHSGTELEHLQYKLETQATQQEAKVFSIKIISQINRVMDIIPRYNAK